MTKRRLPLAVSAVLVLSALTAPDPAAGQGTPVQPYRAGDTSVTALNILPPGQGGHLNGPEFAQAQASGRLPDHFTDQRTLYMDLISKPDGITSGNLREYFKDASFGVPADDVARQYSPRAGVEIIRDKSYNVPHIYGTTRGNTLFGAGYASAEDRLFLMDVLRHAGRGRLTELLGPSESNLRMDCAQFRVADYSEEELQAMLDHRPASADPALVAQARQDIVDYVEGINAYIQEATTNPSKLPAEYQALQVTPRAWRLTDTVAVASLIGGSLGVGGGGELENAAFLNELRAAGHPQAEARAILNDLRFVDDPEAPSTTTDRFPWNVDLGPVDPASVAIPDRGSVVPEDQVVEDSCPDANDGPLPIPLSVDGPFGPIQLRLPEGASNALLVGSKLSKSGNPLAVFGPQVGYWSPEILMELDMHGPGLHARGVGFPGISLYVLLGRGDGYGYSATSASGDQVDVRAVRLCNPSGGTPTINSQHYIGFDGQCTAITLRTESWTAKPSAGGAGLPQQITIRSERVQLAGIPGSVGLRGGTWGIIQARGLINGQPVAFARQRVSYGGEVDSALAYVEMMNPDVINGAADFQRAFGRFNFTFNWFYVDGEDIAYQLGGAHPLRAPGTDPDLPVWDATRWGWPGLLSFEGTPKDRSPARGWITSWNNKQAPGFRAADDNWGFAPVDRVEPLDDGIAAAIANDGQVDLPELVRVMESGATVDLRGYKVLPILLDAISDAGTPRLRSVVDLLRAWSAAGAHRRDTNADGQYEHQPAIAVMDEWWPRVVGAIFGPTLGASFNSCWKRPVASGDPPCPLPYTIDDAVNSRYARSPDQNGSSFNDGFYGQVQKDLRTVLGRDVRAPFSRRYCGGGNLATCRNALIASLDEAVKAVEQAQGNTNPAAWQVDERLDEIRFTTVGVVSIPPMPWQNRPTFQQVLEFRGPGRGGGSRDEGPFGGSAEACLGTPLPDVTQVVGSDGPDLLQGTSGKDAICGFGGKDRLVGFDGRDLIFGGGGADRVLGGAGGDRLAGEGGRDRLKGGGGRDVLHGGSGRDRCSGGPKRDRARKCERGHA